jgi:hypothetical protein
VSRLLNESLPLHQLELVPTVWACGWRHEQARRIGNDHDTPRHNSTRQDIAGESNMSCHLLELGHLIDCPALSRAGVPFTTS